MKLAAFFRDGRQGYGAVKGDGVVDLGRRLPFPDVKALLEAGALDQAAHHASAGPDFPLASARLARPVPYPEKIVCIGVNYFDRNAEYKDGSEQPKWPSVFLRTPDSLVAHGENILRPAESPQLDYEGEIVIVIGKQGRRITENAAESHIAGLTIMNEGSVRDWMRHGKFNVTQGKNFAASGSVGPWIATADEFDGYDDLRITTRVNGEVRQSDTTANLLFPFRYLVHYISTFMELKPGDLIATGTPNGAGARFDPPRYLVPGDLVEVEVPGIGILSNRVADEKAAG